MSKSRKVTGTDPKNYVIGRWNYFCPFQILVENFFGRNLGYKLRITRKQNDEI